MLYATCVESRKMKYRTTMSDISQPSKAYFQYEDVKLPVGVGPALRLITLRPKAAGNQIFCELSAHGWDQNTGFVRPSRVHGVNHILPAPQKCQGTFMSNTTMVCFGYLRSLANIMFD
jgi:hypothetical protein